MLTKPLTSIKYTEEYATIYGGARKQQRNTQEKTVHFVRHAEGLHNVAAATFERGSKG